MVAYGVGEQALDCAVSLNPGVIPVKSGERTRAGIQGIAWVLDSGFRRNDEHRTSTSFANFWFTTVAYQ